MTASIAETLMTKWPKAVSNNLNNFVRSSMSPLGRVAGEMLRKEDGSKGMGWCLFPSLSIRSALKFSALWPGPSPSHVAGTVFRVLTAHCKVDYQLRKTGAALLLSVHAPAVPHSLYVLEICSKCSSAQK